MSSSAELILNWLNEEIKLNPPVKNIIKEFSNGYRFAEILYSINEINDKQFNEFLNTSDVYDIRDNFILLKKYFLDIFELIIRKEEFNEIMNKDISKAVVVLYKLKNCIQKKKINFHRIRISLEDLTQDELEQKVKKIIDYEYFYDIFNKDLLYDLTDEEINYMTNSTRMQFESTSKTYRSLQGTLLEDKIDERPELKLKLIKNKKFNQLFQNSLNSRNIPNQISSYNTVSKKESLAKLPKIYKSFDRLNSNKNIIINQEKTKPFTFRKSNLFLTSELTSRTSYNKTINFGNGKSNIAKEDKFKISKLTDTLYKLGIPDFHSDLKNTLPEFNSLNEKELDKVRQELKTRIRQKKVESQKKQDNTKKEFKIKLYDIPEIDFIHKDKNPLYKETLPIGISMEKHNKYLSYQKRRKYAKQWKIYHKQRQIEKRMKYISSIIKNINNLSKKDGNDNYFYDENIFFSILNKFNIENFNKIITKKRLKLMKDFALIRNISLLIIEMTMEIFFYKEENTEELIDVETYTKLLELFIKNKPMRERMLDAEARLIKERNKDDEEINPDKLILTTEEQNSKDDYKNYVGTWNDDIIMIKEFRGMQFDQNKINEFFHQDYEPTETEIEDMKLPLHNVDNYLYGDVILDLLDNKFISKNKNISTNDGGKWDHIKYKISLIGYPFCGKKFIAGEINKKYPKLKIYSVQKILRNYYDQYKTISEPIEKNPKFKSMRPNQIEQLKQEKENKLKEFEPILKMIQPYIDAINQNNIDNGSNEEQNEKQKEKDNINNKIIIADDEVLLNILVYNIENDYPKIPEEEVKNKVINEQKIIENLIKQKEDLQKQIQESKKHNPKDDQTLLNIEKEIQNIKNNSVEGFILVDFPNNINQCNLLEHYLTGYTDETKLPKDQKMINIESINSLVDFNILPPENNIIKKAGIDFMVNIISKEEYINERFNNIKYDPLNDKIYYQFELSQEIKDKKLVERLLDKIPYFTKEHFDYYKKEYDNNISEIYSFYNQFGFGNIFDNEINILNINNANKRIKKAYQEIDVEILEQNDAESDSCLSSEEKDIDNKQIQKNINNKENEASASQKKEEEIKNRIFKFIDSNVIGFLLRENEEKNKRLFYEQNDDEEKDIIKFEPDIKINEIKGNLELKKTNKEKNYLKNTIDNFDSVLSELQLFSIKYDKHIGKFIHFLERQKKGIYDRLNLIQKKYRDFLNHKTDKREVIHIFCEKYNNFFKEFPDAFNSPLAIQDFSLDIDELNTALWLLINVKETVSIKELQEIKNSNFIEFELKKFYKHIKDLFLLETERFLMMINSIINLYTKKKEESTQKIINLIKNNIDKKKNKKINLYKKEYILRDLIKLGDQNEIINGNEIEFENNEANDKYLMKKLLLFYKKKDKPNPVDYMINKNVETIFDNCISLILGQNEKIDNLFKSLKEAINLGIKKQNKNRLKKEFSSKSINTFFQFKESYLGLEENLKKIIQNEKNKYKYKISFLRSFVFKYMIIVIQTSIKVFQQIDNWIIKSVTLQSDAQNEVIRKLKSILKEKRLINEEQDIDTIELDSFEKSTNTDRNNIEDGKKINKEDNNTKELKKIYERLNIDYLLNDNFINIEIKEDKDNSNDSELNKNKIELKKYKIITPSEVKSKINDIFRSNIGNKLSFKFAEKDFHYHIEKFKELYYKTKQYETKKNIINEDIFYEIFIKKYLFNKDMQDTSTNLHNANNLNIFNEIKDKKINNNNNDINYINNLPFICKALKSLSSKNIKKLFSLFRIPSNHENITKNNEKESNSIKQDSELQEKIEYPNYLNNAEIFTILSLIGCKILTEDLQKELMLKVKHKIINNKFLSKDDYYSHNFWFEEDFEYLNIKIKNTKAKRGSMFESKIIFKKIERKRSKQLTNSTLNLEKMGKKEEIKGMTIKDFLFDIWKDDKEDNFNFNEFINVLKINRYVKELEENTGVKYFDIIFKD